MKTHLTRYWRLWLAGACILYARGVHIIAHPEWTEAQVLRNLWHAWALAVALLLGHIAGSRNAKR